jgi:hypothetical protein
VATTALKDLVTGSGSAMGAVAVSASGVTFSVGEGSVAAGTASMLTTGVSDDGSVMTGPNGAGPGAISVGAPTNPWVWVGAATGSVPGEGTTTGSVPGEGTTTGSVPGEGTTTGSVPGEGTTTGSVPGEGTTTGSVPGDVSPDGVGEGLTTVTGGVSPSA